VAASCANPSGPNASIKMQTNDLNLMFLILLADLNCNCRASVAERILVMLISVEA